MSANLAQNMSANLAYNSKTGKYECVGAAWHKLGHVVSEETKNNPRIDQNNRDLLDQILDNSERL